MEPIQDDSQNTAPHRLETGAFGAGVPAAEPAPVVVLEPGEHLVYRQGRELRVFAVAGEWTHIGRSASCDIRFEDPTVSRRHALVVRRPDGLKLVDDRSMNGVHVNGERVEIHALRDGDRIRVGRHTLHFVRVAVETPLVQALPAEALQV